MPLTKATPEVIDVDKLTVNLKSNTLTDGIRDYVDDTIATTISTLSGLISSEEGARIAADEAAYDLGLANGIDVKLAETNATTVNLNTLALTGKYWIGNTNANRPELSPGIYLEYFELEVVCLSSSDSTQYAKNTTICARRYGFGGTAYTGHTWSPWVLFENNTRLTQEISDRTSGDSYLLGLINTINTNTTHYNYVNRTTISSGMDIDIAPKKGCRFFLLGSGGGGSTRGGGQASDAYGGTGTATTIKIGTTTIVSAGGGTGAGNGYYHYVQGPRGVNGANTIDRDYAQFILILNEKRAFGPTVIPNNLGIGSPAVDISYANQGVGNVGGDGAFCDGIFYNTTDSIITLTITVGTGGAHTRPSTGVSGTNGYAVIYN